jgi:hypothetical protein
MKQIKKILCGAMLTSFLIISSANVFAAPNSNVGDNSSTPSGECVYSETNYMENNESAMDYKTTGSYDLQFNVGNEWGTQDPPPNEPPSSNDINAYLMWLSDKVSRIIAGNKFIIKELFE